MGKEFTYEDVCAIMEPGWAEQLYEEFNLGYMRSIMLKLKQERQQYEIAPSSANVFKAFQLTPFENTSVVILGQDPYPQPGVASGLAFGVADGCIEQPASLMNIITELQDDVGFNVFSEYTLKHWAMQGVLLLNTCLTVRVGQISSHGYIGWNQFIQAVFERLMGRKLVWILWGNEARKHKDSIDIFQHSVIESSHPSPRAAYRGDIPFFGSKPFSRCNEKLVEMGLKPIDWYDHSIVDDALPW